MSLKLTKNSMLSVRGKVDGFYTKKVTRTGNGAMVACGKDFVDRQAIVFILKEGETL